jgi:hypothetical protein
VGVRKGLEVHEIEGVVGDEPRATLALWNAASRANPQSDQLTGFGPRKNNPLALFHHGGELFSQELFEFVVALVRASEEGLVKALIGPVGRAKPNGSAVGPKHVQYGSCGMIEGQTGDQIAATTTSENKTLPT